MLIRRKTLPGLTAAALCLGICACHTLEQIPLAETPYTDAEIRNGSFRSGVPLRQADREIADAVCINSYGSLVYDLGGMAESFSAEVGVDPAPSRVGALLDIIVDRKLRETVELDRRVPRKKIEIPLAGAQQLELAVRPQEGLPAQTVWFGEALFRVRDAAGFLGHLVRSRNFSDMQRELPPEPLPPLPDWKEVKIEQFIWQGRPALRIGNGLLEYEIVPSFGGRLVGFRRPAGKNILEQPPKSLPADLRRGRSYFLQHTRFARTEPAWYVLPGEDLHLFGPYALRFGGEGECILLSRPSLFLQLQTEYRFQLKPRSDQLEVTTVLHNLGSFPRPCGVWSVAVLPTKSIGQIELPLSGKKWDVYADTERFWQDDGDSSFLRIAGIKFHPPQFWAVERRSAGDCSRIRVHLASGEVFSCEAAPGESPAEFPNHVYVETRFTEIEHHSALKELPPGGTVSLREIWSLQPGK